MLLIHRAIEACDFIMKHCLQTVNLGVFNNRYTFSGVLM